ncbi:hypothetical protein [Clostridium magnum]|uniref:Uncharacterized protein n=1 Tax=Clostridium magnum DSM 2767 TaxID=1121326 RepID=A0A162UVZ1_9CLOT|nr:hypothetical protein [Clostridium magnum]KZL94341.1 hypothetical protein CLMAG_13940 [Clostridium magnum DSM 2767]SHJ54243.1 hypothetical protein SAMN02745944_06127 [Clostridium magnum DSM 2767]
MKENREEYQSKITKEITQKLNLDMTKEYSIDEVNELLDKHNMRGGILQFIPTKPHTAQRIIDTLVCMDMSITDAVHKNLGIYEDKSKCDYCENYFSEEETKMFQLTNVKDSPILCEECRRKNKYKIQFIDFKLRISKEEREQFVCEELEYGIDYSDYIERLNMKK